MNLICILLSLFLVLISIGIFMGNSFCLNCIAGYRKCSCKEKEIIHKEKLDKVISFGFCIGGLFLFLEGIQVLPKNYGIGIGLIVILCMCGIANFLLYKRIDTWYYFEIYELLIKFRISSRIVVNCLLWVQKQKEYMMLNEEVIKVIKNEMWDLATCFNRQSNMIPVAFKDVKLVVGVAFFTDHIK